MAETKKLAEVDMVEYTDNTSLICEQDGKIRRISAEKVLGDTILSATSTNIVTGETITISDSLEAPLAGLNIYGKSMQKTTTGANLFDGSEYGKKTASGITIEWLQEEGCFLLNGTATENFGQVITLDIAVEKGAVYTVQNYYGSGKISVPDGGFAVSYFGASDTKSSYKNWKAAALKEEDTNVNGECNYGYISAFWFYITTGVVLNNYKVRIQLAKSSASLPYEPYTGGIPSPNGNYPQEITSVGDREEIKLSIHGANLLDIEKLKQVSNWVGNKSYRHFDIELLPNTTYTLSVDKNNMYKDFNTSYNGRYACYVGTTPDASAGNVPIGNVNIDQSSVKTKYTFTTTNKPYYLNLFVYSWDNSVLEIVFEELLQGLQLSISNAALPYEAYQERTFEISTPNGLLGIPVATGGNYTDSDGQQWVCDERDYKRGKYVQRVRKVILDGSEDEGWRLYSNTPDESLIVAYRIFEGAKKDQKTSICNMFTNKEGAPWDSGELWDYADHHTLPNKYFNIPKAIASTIEEWKTWLSTHPLVVAYLLEVPIETDLPGKEIQAFKELHTYKPNTTIMSDSEPQAGMKVEYALDMKTYVDNKFLELATQVLENA